jgi:hypothetical protein
MEHLAVAQEQGKVLPEGDSLLLGRRQDKHGPGQAWPQAGHNEGPGCAVEARQGDLMPSLLEMRQQFQERGILPGF